ncbi:extracellular solute-binding protein [Aureibacillus halotolerans]|uniref:Carbohydrate ABC transporter substrate-binding protein (CUT1 family) n=1 Tax=Aureibacillus halotolerans TaxID=1508390 RepID=A0A4V3D673_9BACI|nr:extracellular solute-binding protein [Aureibacillus halotolerans]TDQ42857.1 carbohydrate ABC transporter substrate-binding protein (CUT1 family) [Aureibacillus halotolerans]
MKKVKKKMMVAMAGMLLATTACSSGNEQATGSESADNKRFSLDIMLPAFKTELPDSSSRVIQKLEEETDTNVDIIWVPDSSYNDKFNITLASGTLPTILVADPKMPSFVNAARNGAFWDLTPYLENYPNLSQMNETIKRNASIDGKTYGIYRARPLGRMGVTARSDWMENVDLDQPKTIEEFYELLKAFTNDDPDQNGKDDTYGLVMTKYSGPWDIMQVWFGAPNKWGENDEGKLMPTHTFPEYLEALNFFKKLYDEGLINSDFAVRDSAIWTDDIVNDKAGVIVDVADHASRIEEQLIEKDAENPGTVDVFQAPAGPKGQLSYPTSGYSKILAISKEKVGTEEELDKVLTFLDQLNNPEIGNLITSGIEGVHYENMGDYIEPTDDPALQAEKEGLNQLSMSIVDKDLLNVKQTEVRKKVDEVMKANEDTIVPNPAEPLISDEYAKNGAQLDKIIEEARIKYIVGQIDEAQLQAELDRWMESGGEVYINEINQLYDELESVQ